MQSISELVWNKSNCFGIVHSKNSLQLFDEEGNSLRSLSWKKSISHIKFPEQVLSGMEKQFSVIVKRQGLAISDYSSEESKIKELHFLPEYGEIVDYSWFGKGFIVVGFSAGMLVVISANLAEDCRELYQHRAHDQSLHSLTVSSEIGKLASVGDHCLKDIKEVTTRIELDSALGNKGGQNEVITKYNDTGQVLMVGLRQSKKVYMFLTTTPTLIATKHNTSKQGFHSLIARQDSINEISLEKLEYCPKDCKVEKTQEVLRLSVASEPLTVAVTESYLAYATETRVFVHQFRILSRNSSTVRLELVGEFPFDKIVTKLGLGYNSCTCLLEDGSTAFMGFGTSEAEQEAQKQVQKILSSDRYLDLVQSEKLLFLCSVSKKLICICTETGQTITDYIHKACSIRSLYLNSSGTKGVFIDSNHCGFVINFATNFVQKVASFPNDVSSVHIDCASGNFVRFVIFD
ncbi:WD repeat-containing protein 19 [Cichlidogyrus casuarinus]|uniref:WD repeat-containing protein 19 n=1 Tax=Cichlidogyrus casuarinus TaxID=1844966 RepID=A0ABD2Q4G0_9PLAT